MKSYSYELTYLELAKLFITTQNQIAAWIKRSKFNLNKPSSIFEFYRTEGMKIVKRREEFDILLVKYKSRTLKAPKEKEYVERMLREWKREDELIDEKSLLNASKAKYVSLK